MPTPVSTARQCLTEESARALDDAVAVARRRSHAQTTSLHALSALLSMPTSVLRETCVSRARNSAYPSRLQFRALELCVGVSLDRLPSSKSPAAATDEDPPVSNSLMAAIKRSQANQRRHPETYHLQQIHSSGGNQTPSVLRVELKYFILSILDDPIVSRVFGEAGFRSSDIKLDVLHPPVTQFSSRFARSRCPPLFLCNLQDSDSSRVGFGFHFRGNNEFDDNCRRIGEILSLKDKKNPLLIGNCAGEALKTFVDLVNRGRLGFLPLEISGLNMISIEKEISEVFIDGSINLEEIRSKLDELEKNVEQKCSTSRLVLNLGEIKVSIGEFGGGALEKFVSKISDMLKLHEQKLWLIGSVSSNETHSKLLDRFPTIEKDWNLHLLPITSSSKPLNQGVYPKSSLMGSFVPFGGFFPSTCDFRIPFSGANQSLPRCHLCNEKYEQEAASVVKADSSVSVADQFSEKLPSWLRAADPETDQGMDLKVKDDESTIGSRITGLQKKWDDICQRNHQTPAIPRLNIRPSRSQYPAQFASDQIEKSAKSPTAHVGMPENFQKVHNTQIQSSSSSNFNLQPRLSVKVSKPQHMDDYSGMSPMSCVTTDLGLGTIYASSGQEANTPISLDQRDFATNGDKPLMLNPRSSVCSTSIFGSSKDFKALKEYLSQKVSWQVEAVDVISEIVSGCQAKQSSKSVWLAFLGPDRVGKRKIASAMADILFGSQQNLISADFRAWDNLGDGFRCKTVVDYVAGELARKPRSVVFLENVDNAEFPDQIRLSDAAKSGKLRSTHGREISMNNVIFVVTSGIVKNTTTHFLKPSKFSEERISASKTWKMQIKLGCDRSAIAGTSLQSETSASQLPNKRKQDSAETEPRIQKVQRSFLDLNRPVEEIEENNNTDETDSITESTEAWLEDFLGHFDGNVTFKPFDSDGLAKKIKSDIILHFRRSFGPEANLEIDEDVIVQILAGYCSSDDARTLDLWMQNVLARSFALARQKYGMNPRFVVNLVACKEEQVAGEKLPAKIELL